MRYFYSLLILIPLLIAPACRRTGSDIVTVALPEPFTTFDTLMTEKSDAVAERVKNLIFNALVKKTETFDYEGELAESIETSEDGKVITFRLRKGVKFHNGKDFTSSDVKYTFDELLASKAYKKFAFLDVVGKEFVPHITQIETPDPLTVVFNLARPSLKNQLLSNLVAVPIVAEGTAKELAGNPIGTGPFKFVSFDSSQNTAEFAAFEEFWGGAPKVKKLRVKTVTDASALQAELQTGGVDIAPVPSNLPPDTIKLLGDYPNLKVEQFDGSNIQYLGFNTSSPTLDNVKIRQAIAFSIDRDKLIRELLSNQAKTASSILPPGSWAYSPGKTYSYDLAKAKALVAESGYKNEPIVFMFSSGNAAYSSYVQAIQNMVVEAGLNVRIETVDPNGIRENLAKGLFEMNTGVWVGGNQDPIFMRDLFTSAKIPGQNVSCCNRWRYKNAEVDSLVETAFNETDRAKAKDLYIKAWEIISDELPLFPLWYPANMVVANKRIENIKMNASGDWTFLKDITVK